MQRRHFLAGGASASLATLAGGADAARQAGFIYADPTHGQFGGVENLSAYRGVQAAIDPTAFKLTVLERAIEEESGGYALLNLPPVATQGVSGSIGSPGTCEAQSFGYCLGSITAGQKPDGSFKWSANEPRNQPSAAWLYHMEHVYWDTRTCPGGTLALPMLDQLVANGAPSTHAYPYNPNDKTTVTDVCTEIDATSVENRRLPEYRRLRLGSYKAWTDILNNKEKYVAQFCRLLRAGHAIAFSGLVASNYAWEHPVGSSIDVYRWDQFIPGSGHGQVIVGYHRDREAFLVQNSCGPDWNSRNTTDPGFNGRIWWDYDTFFSSQSLAAIAFPDALDAPSGTPFMAGTKPTRYFLKEAHRRTVNEKHHLILILQGDDAMVIRNVQVNAPKGVRVSTAELTETIRYGYIAFEYPQPFPPGHYEIEMQVSDAGSIVPIYKYHVTIELGEEKA